MGKKQLPYFTRATAERRPGFKPQERDLAILEAVMSYRFISSGQLHALFKLQMGKRALQRRLKKMFHNGFLNRPKSQLKLRLFEGQRELIYSLGPKGVTYLSHQRGIDREDIKWQVRSAESVHLRHTLMIAKFRIALTLASESPEEKAEKRLGKWKREYKSKKGKEPSEVSIKAAKNKLIREERKNYRKFIEEFMDENKVMVKNKKDKQEPRSLDPTLRLKDWQQGKEIIDKTSIWNPETQERDPVPVAPDAYFHLHFPNRKEDKDEHWFFEADRGTMTKRRFLKKMQAYWVYQFGTKRENLHLVGDKWDFNSFRVLTITENQGRKESLRKVSKRANGKEKGSNLFWFGCEKDYNLDNPESVLKKIFKTPASIRLRSILE